MKLRKDTEHHGFSNEAVNVLIEALPWIKNITGKTVVIKYGGAAMVDPKLRSDVMTDIVLLKIIGVNPVIVHGGGADITEEMELRDLPVEFIDGQRVTSDAAMEVVRMVLSGKVNQELVESMNEHGRLAVGVSGCDAGTIMAKQADVRLGRVGKITDVNAGYLNDLVNASYIPVVASVAKGEDGGFYNVNADVAAGCIAAAIGAHKIMFLTDVDGLYRDFSKKETLISRLSIDEAKDMIAQETISTGMIPKLQSCVSALDKGVHRAQIVNGTTPHALLLEILTNTGVGTMVYQDESTEARDTHPLGDFAAKLVENW